MPQKKKSNAAEATPIGSGDDSKVTTQDTIRVKSEMDKVKAARNRARASQKAGIKRSANQLMRQIKHAHDSHIQELAEAGSEQINRLIQALEKRSKLEEAIAAKLEAAQHEFSNLANLLESVYDGRLEELRKAALPVLPTGSQCTENCSR